MLRQKIWLTKFPVYLLDILLTVGAFFIAYRLRDNYFSVEYGYLLPAKNYAWLLLLIVPVWTFFLYYFAAYKSLIPRPFWWDFWQMSKVVFWGALLFTSLLFLFRMQEYVSRLFIFFFAFIDLVLLSVEKTLLRYIVIKDKKKGHRNVLIVGTEEIAKEVAGLIKEHKHWGMKMIGFITEDPASGVESIDGYEVLGLAEDIPNIINDLVVDEIVFAVSKRGLEEYEELILLCEEMGIDTRITVNFLPHKRAKLHMENLYGLPTLTFTNTPYNEFLLLIKRAFDIVISAFLLLCLSPFMIFIGLIVKLTSKGPAIFTQERVGLNGRIFNFYKFRSMVQDAEQIRKTIEHLNEVDGPVFKIKNDPRITPVGRFIRKTSIDELPQLFNVLKGEMSLVGPRPPIPSEVEKYDRWQRRRLSMRPGLTCLWQISGRSNLDFNTWMKLDLKYIDEWSLGLDLKIFLKTIPVVLFGKGAA